MKLDRFFAKHPVFTVEEFDEYLGKHNLYTRNALLTHHRKSGRIMAIRRGLYAVVPPGSSPESTRVDLFLLASKMTADAVLGYHTALEFHGKAYSVFNKLYYLSDRKSQPVQFRSYEFISVLIPKAIRGHPEELFGLENYERLGIDIRATNLERTFVDVMDRPDISGGWEEIWRSLESVEYFKLDEVVEYALLLGNATTASKVGFYLDQHRSELHVKDSQLDRLRNLRPRQPHYLDRNNRKGGQLVAAWNLVVPETVLNHTWEEVT
jgi:predicted transcriptional regulator of viral defense system